MLTKTHTGRRADLSMVIGLVVATLSCQGGGTPGAARLASSSSAAADTGLALRIDHAVSAFMESQHVQGISVAVVRGGDTITFKGYGLADVENQVPATPATVYRIGSITKQFTSAAIMRLVEQGKVRLDAPLSTYLTTYPEPGRGATIQQLLTHTSGIPSYTGLGPRFHDKIRLDLTDQQLLDLFEHVPLDFVPGSQWRYDNSGYYLLGMVIARTTHTTYADHIEKTLADPLGLSATRYCQTAPIIPHRAAGYSWNDGHTVNASPLSMNIPGAAGSLCSTVGDLVRWERALTGGQVVSRASFALMTTPAVLVGGKQTTYGFGLGISQYRGHPLISHSGGINGFSAELAYYPADTLTVAVLTNEEGIDAALLARRIAKLALGMRDSAAADLPVPPATRHRYVGRYTRPGNGVQIDEVGDRLVMADDVPRPLLYQGGDAFVLKDDPDFHFQFLVAGDRVTGCRITTATGTPEDFSRQP